MEQRLRSIAPFALALIACAAEAVILSARTNSTNAAAGARSAEEPDSEQPTER